MKCLKRMFGMVGLVLALLVAMTASSFAAANWEESTLTAEGMGVAPATAYNPTQAKMLARRAALVDAYRQLLEMAKGVDVDASTTVENMMVTSDIITTHVSGVVNGARIVDEKSLGDGAYSVTVSMPLFGSGNSLASAVFQKRATIEPYPDIVPDVTPSRPVNPQEYFKTYPSVPSTQPYQPSIPDYSGPSTQPIYGEGSSASSAPSGRAIGGYTGLIVDCRGLDLRPVMSPVIKNAEGTPIYGYKNLNYDKVVANGMAGYTRDITKATRAGSHPLVVKAIAAADHNGNPVLSVADANRVLIENGATGFLDTASVVFVR